MLYVRLLGELQAEVDGRSVLPPPSRRAWTLLAWLALHPGEHPRGAVAARFWPDVLDTSARASLRSAVWALRRALGEDTDALSAGRDRIGLRCETDLARFDAHVAAGELEPAVTLCRGPLLADLDDDWVLEARDEHAERLGGALARLAAAASDPTDAVAYARRRLALDPLDEDAARDLMRCYTDAGDRAGALAAYDRLATRLRTHLGLAPSAETRALAAAIRTVVDPEGWWPRDEPVQRGHAVAVHSSAPDEPDTDARVELRSNVRHPPLIGRDPELAALLRLFHAGTGALALITGEPGIGKTRLATELLAHAEADGALTAHATALDLGGGAPPFGQWSELLAQLARHLEPPPATVEWPEELARLAPSLPRRLGRPPRPHDDVPPDLARARLFEAAVELAEYATATRPLVLLFDDAHAADPSTLELTAYVARRVRDLPVLLVLTRRPHPRRDAIDALARSSNLPTIELQLDPLTSYDVERLVGRRPDVIVAADGNPLLALESARAPAANGLKSLVRAAIVPLSEPARRATELAAVAGRDLEHAELAAITTPPAVLEATESGLFTDGRFGFRHALLRDAVYADLDAARRRAHHETLGHTLGNAAERAHHLAKAGRDDLAAQLLVRAAADATRATALEQAADFLKLATELHPTPETQLELANTLALLGDRDGSRAAFARAGPHGAHHHLRAAQWFRGGLCDPAGALDAARKGLACPDADVETRAELLLVRAWAEAVATTASDAYATLAQVDHLDLEPDPLRTHHMHHVRGFIALAEGRLEEAERELAESGSIAERAGRPDLAYGGWANAACIATAAGRLGRALALAERGLVTGVPVIELQMEGVRAGVLARLNRHAEARAANERQRELARRLGSRQLGALADHDGGLLALQAGDDARAAELLARALEQDPPIQRGEARLRRAEALARLGRPDEADAEIRAATTEPVRPADRPAVLVARMTFAQALSAAARGDAPLAHRRLEEAAGHWRRLHTDAGGEFIASLIDLGRLPVAGVADPARELERIDAVVL